MFAGYVPIFYTRDKSQCQCILNSLHPTFFMNYIFFKMKIEMVIFCLFVLYMCLYCINMHRGVCFHTHTYTHTHIHTHLHTNTHSPTKSHIHTHKVIHTLTHTKSFSSSSYSNMIFWISIQHIIISCFFIIS